MIKAESTTGARKPKRGRPRLAKSSNSEPNPTPSSETGSNPTNDGRTDRQSSSRNLPSSQKKPSFFVFGKGSSTKVDDAVNVYQKATKGTVRSRRPTANGMTMFNVMGTRPRLLQSLSSQILIPHYSRPETRPRSLLPPRSRIAPLSYSRPEHQWSRMARVPDDDILAFARLFVQHNAHKTLGIHLVHGNVDLADDIILLGKNFDNPFGHCMSWTSW